MKQNNANAPIKVLHCVAGLGRGGYETFIMNIFRKIDTSKVTFDFLYSFDGVYNEEIRSLGGNIYKIPFITQIGPIAYRQSVLKFIKNHPEYTIIHSHMDKFSGLIMKLAKSANVTTRIAHSHSTKNEGGYIYNLVKNFYGKSINSNCTHRFACSQDAYLWLFKDNEENKRIVKNAIDLNKFKVQDDRNKDNFTVINVGRFVHAKNHSFLIDVFYHLKQVESTAQLILVGEGALQPNIRQKVQSLNLAQSVKFINDSSDVRSLLSRADVFCMPSLFEGLGIALIEAQAVGLNCVASSTIPSDTNISGNVSYISLSKPAHVWAKEILKFKSAQRNNNHDLIKAAGYDVNTVAQQLQNFYLENG